MTRAALKDLLIRALPFLHEAAEPFEDDGGNEPLELARAIESALESPAALSAMEGEAVAYMICYPDGDKRVDLSPATCSQGATVRPLIYGDTAQPPQQAGGDAMSRNELVMLADVALRELTRIHECLDDAIAKCELAKSEPANGSAPASICLEVESMMVEFKACWPSDTSRSRRDRANALCERFLRLRDHLRGWKGDKIVPEWLSTPPQPEAGGGVTDAKYAELLYAVSRKHPGESRHETALRYIRQAENQNHGPAAALSTTPASGGEHD